MRFRLQSEEIRSLYATGRSSRFPSDVVMAIFGVLEAIEAAPGLSDLRSLASLRLTTHSTGKVEFGLSSGYTLGGRQTNEAGTLIIVIEEIRGEGKGGPGD
ncbi:MAG: hypothetical protein FIA92_01170 [Chloroflexi bacterium]|nr:hypothetical protein [Chloroflexota bacterium]